MLVTIALVLLQVYLVYVRSEQMVGSVPTYHCIVVTTAVVDIRTYIVYAATTPDENKRTVLYSHVYLVLISYL